MMRNLGRGTALALLLLGSVGAPAAEDGPKIPLPPGVRPFSGSITLRYAALDHFTYGWRSDMEAPRGSVLLEGWVMEGSARRQGDTLEWSYRLSNLGRDGRAHEMGALEVVTDAWGAVRSARVIEDRWRQGRGAERAAADRFFDPAALRFPLCCCPSGPLRMGDVVETPAGIETLPAAPRRGEALPPEVAEFSMRSVVAGLLTRDGRDYLVLRHVGSSTAEADGARATGQTSGFTALDVGTCLPVAGIRASSVETTGGPGAPVFAVIRRSGSGY